jgi:hypothetical protein
MKNKNIINPGRTALIILPLFLLSLFLLSSCKEEPVQEDPFFTIEGDPTGLTVTKAAKTQAYVVRSNRPWQIVKKEDAAWVKAFPEKGEADGIFKIIVKANETFDTRIVNFAFVVDGKEQPVMFRVEQEGSDPYVTVPAALTVPSAGGVFSVDVASNVEWEYSLSDDSWLTEQSVTSQKITFVAEPNLSSDEREVILTVTGKDYPVATGTVTLSQSSATVVLEENFSWLAYGSAVPYTTTGETIITNWTQEQKDKGWTASLNPFSNDYPLYARQGFVKLGKTNYGGDLISPKLSRIIGTQTVRVTFKAAAYVSAGGTVIDSRVLRINVLGAGVPSVDMIMIENVPNNQAEDNAGIVNDIWDPARAWSFTITGATADTQIQFLGKAFDLRGEVPTTNRIFLDDIKVEIVL